MPSEVMSMREPYSPTIPGPSLLSSGRYIHFGPFRIDQQRQEVTRNGSRLKLQGKVYQTLLTLLEKPGEVVTRRSEEHTSELQSHHDLVCRLLLEKKKKQNKPNSYT